MATPFALFVHKAGSPTIYGVTATGKFVAFQTWGEFLDAGGTSKQIQERGAELQIPGDTVTYKQFLNPTTAPPPSPSPAPSSPTAPASNAGTVDITKPVAAAEFKTTDAYKALSPEVKDFVDIAYNLVEVGGEAEAKMFADAVAQAKSIADPYYKTQLTLANAEVLGSIAEKRGDYETKREVIQRARDELLADVGSNKEFLSLEQQAEISRLAKEYDTDLLTIADQAAEKGLTFATGARSRALAEERRTDQYSDVVQSSRRQFNFRIKELELKAARGDVDAQKQLEALNQQKTFSLQQIGRAAEEVLGSANLPTVEGYTPVGGVAGKIEEEKQAAILKDTSGFYELQKGLV